MKKYLLSYSLAIFLYCGALQSALPSLEFLTAKIDLNSQVDAKKALQHDHHKLLYPGSLVILPEDGRQVYFEAFAAARHEIRIEICVLEDPLILRSLKQALQRGVHVRVIVDNGKYTNTPAEQEHLATYLTEAGGQLHLSNPIFPRSFPKVILIDECYALISSACLDTVTFAQYRDYTYVSASHSIIKAMARLFENDWQHSAPPGQAFSPFNPTPPITHPYIIVGPVNASARLVSFIQKARKTLDVTSELLGNPTLESELAAAVVKGVRVRLLAPAVVNKSTAQEQALQTASLNKLAAAGIQVRVTRSPQNPQFPYMHARTAVADRKRAYLGSISLAPNSSTYNREVSLILKDRRTVDKLQRHFKIDFSTKSELWQEVNK